MVRYWNPFFLRLEIHKIVFNIALGLRGHRTMERERGEGRRQQGARGAGLLSGKAEEDVTAHSLDSMLGWGGAAEWTCTGLLGISVLLSPQNWQIPERKQKKQRFTLAHGLGHPSCGRGCGCVRTCLVGQTNMAARKQRAHELAGSSFPLIPSRAPALPTLDGSFLFDWWSHEIPGQTGPASEFEVS